MGPIIGTFSIQQGTSQRDVAGPIPSGVAYFGGAGDDYISAQSTGVISLDGKQWWVPSLLSGGSGNDQYSVGPGDSCFIEDAYNSSRDSIRIYDYSRNIVDFFSIEGRHLFISTTWGTNVLVIDALNSRGAIETIAFSDITFSGSPESSSTLLKSYQTSGDKTIDQLMSQDDFNPRVMGVQTAQDVRNIIQSLYSYNIENSSALSRVSGALTNPVLSTGAADYFFYNLGAGRYGIQNKNKTTIDEVTGLSLLSFNGSTVSVANDIKGVFDQLTGKETLDAQMYRLYNAAFARFPDASGLRFWISQYANGSEYNSIAKSFIDSAEFKSRYGANSTNEDYSKNLYKNVLGRLPDAAGLLYWVNTLETGINSRENVLSGFAESIENKTLFSQVTGFL